MSGQEKARVTVVTPMYNARDYVLETVESVLAQCEEPQAVTPVEYVAVDDGSTDDSCDLLLRQFGDRLRLLRQPNGGEVSAVNRGVREASSGIVGIVNADDPLLPGLLKAAVSVLEANPDVVAVYPDWEMIDAQGAHVRTVTTLEFDLRIHLEQHLCIPGPGAFFRVSALNGEPPRDPRFPYTSDYDMWLRLALRGRIVRIPAVLATWRTHSAGTSQSARNRQMAANKVDMITSFFTRPDLPAHVQAWRRQSMASALYCAGLLAIHDPRVPGRRYLLRSLALRPVWPAHFTAERRRSWVRILYILCQPVSRWIYRFALWGGLVRDRL